jgi:hypothetical protein
MAPLTGDPTPTPGSLPAGRPTLVGTVFTTGPERIPLRDTQTRKPGRIRSFFEQLRRPPCPPISVFDREEVAALLKYASERGIDTKDHLLTRLYRALTEYDKDPTSEMAVLSDGNQRSVPNAELILQDYSRLTGLTDGVNGRNLISGRRLVRETIGFLCTTFVIFVASISALAYGAWVADETQADDRLFPAGVAYTIEYFAPFGWGALGSCVYILKRITDEAAENRFDPDRFQGWLTRALLGAILGGTITEILDPDAVGTATLSLTAIAFLTGLGTKVVYGGLERTITLLSEKMNLNAVSKAKPKANAISEFLAQEVSHTNPETEPEKYKALLKLLDSRSRPS